MAKHKVAFLIVALLIALMPLRESMAAQVLLKPQLSLREQYTDNVFLSPSDEVDDYITTADLKLSLQILSRTAGMELVLNPAYNTFADHSDLDFWRYAGRIDIWNDFGRNTRFELTSDYLETENPRDQSASAIPGNPLVPPAIGVDLNRRGRNRYRTDVSEARLTHQFGAKDNFYAALLYSYLEDIDKFPGVAVNDYTNWQPSLGMEYWFTERWGLAFDGYYSKRDYVDQNDREEYSGILKLQRAFSQALTGFVQYHHTLLNFDQPTDDDYQIYEPSLGFTYLFQNNAKITLGAGYYIQDFANQDENQEGWILNSEIYKRWTFRSSYVSIAGTSGYVINDRGSTDLGLDIYYQARLEAGYNFTARLSGSIFGAYRIDDYPDQVPDRTDNTLTTGANLAYQALQWMKISLNYNYTDLSSDIPAQEYRENSVFLMITMQPSAPYRLN